MSRPVQCPECGCPIQLLAEGNTGQTRGDIHDAMEAHYRVVHPLDEGPGEVTE